MLTWTHSAEAPNQHTAVRDRNSSYYIEPAFNPGKPSAGFSVFVILNGEERFMARFDTLSQARLACEDDEALRACDTFSFVPSAIERDA